jgi:DNA polymerase-3 subunit delta
MKTIDEDIKTGNFAGIYLLCGDENYLKKQYKNKLLAALVPPQDTMNLAKYEGNGVSVGEIIDLAETLPFFAEHRVICLTNTEFFASSQEDLAAYLANIPETTCLIFMEDKVDKRSKTYKAAAKYGRAVSFSMPDEKTLMRWMTGRIKKEGKSITRDAWDEFLLRCGDNMEHMDKEMEKLLSYVYDRDSIGLEDVDAICTRQVQSKVFDMISHLASKNLPKTLELYHDMLAAREPAPLILNLIARQFTQMYLIRDLGSQGMNVSQIADKTGIRDFIVRKNMGLARNFTAQQIRSLLEDAADYEERFKTGLLNDRLAVELLMIKYCG